MPNAPRFDRENLRPVLRASICTGEKSAGFVDRRDGKFHEVCLIRNAKDLEAFRARYGITEEIKTEW